MECSTRPKTKGPFGGSTRFLGLPLLPGKAIPTSGPRARTLAQPGKRRATSGEKEDDIIVIMSGTVKRHVYREGMWVRKHCCRAGVGLMFCEARCFCAISCLYSARGRPACRYLMTSLALISVRLELLKKRLSFRAPGAVARNARARPSFRPAGGS